MKLDLLNLCEDFQTMAFNGAAKSKCRNKVNEEMMNKLLSKFPKKIIAITDTEIQKVYETAPTGPAGLKTLVIYFRWNLGMDRFTLILS